MPSKDRSRARRGVLCLLAGAALMLAGAYLLAEFRYQRLLADVFRILSERN